MSQKIELVYWDTTIWLAYIKGEDHIYGEAMEGVYLSAQKVLKGEQQMLISSVHLSEISLTKNSNAVRVFQAFKDRKTNVFLRSFDFVDGEMAMKIREAHRKMQTPDAQHLAMAIHYKVDAFYTFDSGNSGGENLLALNGNVAGHPLTIIKPPLPQQRSMGTIWSEKD